MPARKPKALNTRNDTKEDAQARAAAEAAMTPKTALPLKPPAVLNGHKRAKEIWSQVIGQYSETDGNIATVFDLQLLISYCMVVEEEEWLLKLRTKVEKLYTSIERKLARMKTDDLKNYYNVMNQLNALLGRLQGFDARLDGKRKLRYAYEQGLYLTPRSRAGVEPPMKEDDAPKSEMEGLL